MNRFISLCIILCIALSVHAQNVAVNTDGSVADRNAILDIKSENKGVLIPRMTSEARMKIANTQGLIVYDVNTNSFWYNTGKSWLNLPGTSSHAVEDVALQNTFFGTNAGWQTFVSGNTAIGHSSMYTNTHGFHNTAVGAFSLLNNTRGFQNSAFGRLALEHNTTGNFNTAVGASALLGNNGGNENVAVGVSAGLGNSNSNGNTAVGTNSQFFHQGNANTSVGHETLAYYDGGTGNTALGYHALRNVTPDANYNVGVGYDVRIFNFSNSTAVGSNAMVEGNNSTALGSGAVANTSNKVRIGNAAVTVIEGQVPFTFPSDGRFKFGVQEDVKGLDFIMQLRPVTYHFDTKRFDAQIGETNASDAAYDEATAIRRSGFIAQEVDQAAQKSGYDFSGIIKPKTAKEHYSLSYDAFVVPLVKAVQEQQSVINAQQRKIDDQQRVNDALNKKLNDMQRELDEIKKALKLQ